MSAIPSGQVGGGALGRTSTIPSWRYALVVLGAGLGLGSGFGTLFSGSLPIFLLPIAKEFGWGRGDTAMAAVLAMLGITLASPFVGRLFDRCRPERVIGISVLCFAAGTFAMSSVPGSLLVLGGLCLCIGLSSAATTMVGYASVLPRWFDGRLGLALGVMGVGGAMGIAMAPLIANQLIQAFGWRSAYQVLAGIALGVGGLACLLLRPRSGERPPVLAARSADGQPSATEGMTLRDSIRDRRFWLLLAVTFAVPFSVLGIALHGAALFMDRGMTASQAATGAALGGLGAITGRVCVGALLDRFSARRVAAVVFTAAALGLLLNSWATSFALLSAGAMLGGAAMGAEGDLLPFMIRRYFGMRAFGTVFGSMHSAYALGGVLGPIAYGYTFDRLGTYSPLMWTGSVLCVASALAVTAMGEYRYRADTSR